MGIVGHRSVCLPPGDGGCPKGGLPRLEERCSSSAHAKRNDSKPGGAIERVDLEPVGDVRTKCGRLDWPVQEEQVVPAHPERPRSSWHRPGPMLGVLLIEEDWHGSHGEGRVPLEESAPSERGRLGHGWAEFPAFGPNGHP